MGLVEADLDPGVCVSMATIGIPSHTPLEDHPLATHSEPSALYCWILKILYCNPKGRRALLWIPSTKGEVFAYVGLPQNLRDQKDGPRLGRYVELCNHYNGHRGNSKLRTHTALGPYGRSIPRSIAPS